MIYLNREVEIKRALTLRQNKGLRLRNTGGRRVFEDKEKEKEH